MQPGPEGKSLNERGSQTVISPLGGDVDVKMRRIFLADVSNRAEIFNVTEMSQLRRVFEAPGEIPDDATGRVKRDKKTSPVVCNISAEPAL